MSNRAWVTLATNDSYGVGALVLAHSLRRAGSAYPVVVLITPSVTEAMRDRLSATFAEVVTVDVLDSGDAAHLALLQRPELGITFTKIHCWNLTQFDKCVFLDADTLVVQNCDELFEREELSAAPDVGWPDCFNSGVFVFKPSAETFSSLIKFAEERGSFDGGDQGLLNSFFSDWAHGDINKHLPFLYNVTSAAFYSYLPALKHYGQSLKIIHFIGAAKPWLQQFNWESRTVDAPEHLKELLQLWWDLFISQVHSQLDVSMVEVEEVPTAIAPPQESIFCHTEPMSNYNNYKPVLDPDSEFHWHRPEAQIPNAELVVPEIDMTQFHDPWDIYRGHIPALTEETKSTCSYSQPFNEQQEIRRHVWEQPSSQQFIRQKEEPLYSEPHHEESHYTPVCHSETHYNIGEHITTPHNEFHQGTPYYNEVYHNSSHNNEFIQESINRSEFHNSFTNQNESRDNGTYFDQSKSFTPETHHFQQLQDSSSQSVRHYDLHQNQYHENFVVENRTDLDSQPSYNYDYDKSSFCNNSATNYRNEFIDHNSGQNYVSQSSDRSQSETDRRQEYQSFHQHYTTILESNNDRQYEFSYSQSKEQEVNSAGEENPNNNADFSEQSCCHHGNNTLLNSESTLYKNDITSHHLQKLPEDFIHPFRNKVEYVYCLYLDHERERNRQREKHKGTTDATKEKINGFNSETEFDDVDDFIIPRHPYDGFYLRHRMTIDSRGRKICTHEIPPTPSPSPSVSPPGSPVYFDAMSESSSPEDDRLEAMSDEHSGVAGNLARVSPDPSGLQRGALDELSRRQGWEAGNIDYMGADSFDNIWAKISQTLSQPPASPPKEPTPPPVEISSPQVETSEAKESEVPASEVPLPAEKEIEVSPVAAEKPEESTLVLEESNKEDVSVEAAASLVAPATGDTPVPVDVPAPVEAPAPVDVPAPVDAPAPVDVPAPADAPIEKIETAPSESCVTSERAQEGSLDDAVPVEPREQEAALSSENVESSPQDAKAAPVVASAPIEALKSDAVVSEEASTPVETAAIPAESSVSDLPSEIPVPVVEAVLEEVKAPLDESTLKPEEVPAPVIEASAQDVSKEDLSAVTATEVAPNEKSVDVPKSSESPKDAVAEPIVSDTPQSKVVPPPESPAAGTKFSSPPSTPAEIPAATDSPPLANTPSTEEIPTESSAQAEERRKPVGKLQLRPPAAADPLPTPDSELEDAAALAQSIIASELRTPTVTSPSPQSPASPAQLKQETRLSAEESQPPTPPVGSVSLSQIGIKAAKGKPSIAAQIESSVSPKTAPASPPAEPKAATDAPKKKIVKKVLKKESAASGEAPVPPPRKKEKKPKEK